MVDRLVESFWPEHFVAWARTNHSKRRFINKASFAEEKKLQKIEINEEYLLVDFSKLHFLETKFVGGTGPARVGHRSSFSQFQDKYCADWESWRIGLRGSTGVGGTGLYKVS